MNSRSPFSEWNERSRRAAPATLRFVRYLQYHSQGLTADEGDSRVNSLQVRDLRRPVSQALGIELFAMNYFDLGPGDSFSGDSHRHLDQEAGFYIQTSVEPETLSTG